MFILFCFCLFIFIFIGFIRGGLFSGVIFLFFIFSLLVDLGVFILFVSIFGFEIVIVYVVVGLVFVVFGGLLIEVIGLG